MKKNYLILFISFLFFNFAQAQNKEFNLFRDAASGAQNNLGVEMRNFMNTSKTAELLILNQESASLLYNQGGNFNFKLALKEQTVELRLEEAHILGQNFKVFNKKGETQEVILPRFYKGQIVGDNSSFVTLSVLPDAIDGLISGKNINYTFGKIKEATTNLHIAYSSNESAGDEKFECQTVEVREPKKTKEELHKQKNLKTNTSQSVDGCRVIEIFFEADYDLYQKNNSSSTTTATYIANLFNNVAYLYEREGVNIKINSILINTTTDSYASLSSSGEVLDNFSMYDYSATGADLAHFLSSRNLGGGIAYIIGGPSVYGGMTQRAVFSSCSNQYAYGVSGNLSSTIVPVPAFSWNVMVVAHELGHNFGLPHTHSCSWPGGAIDGCQEVEGSCSSPAIPSSGGTIMSYCHQTLVGINLSLGFGEMPGDKLRAEVAAANCLGGTASTTVIANDVYKCEPSKITLTASGCGTGTYQWFDSQTSTTVLSSSSTFVTPLLTSTTNYYVTCTLPANCTSQRKKVIAGIGKTLPTVIPGKACAPTSIVSLEANCISGTVNWYSSETSTIALATGNLFTTPALSASTVYFVRCQNEACLSDAVAIEATITEDCYCTEPEFDCSDGEVITSIKITKNNTELFKNISSCSPKGYGDYTNLPILLNYDSTYTISYTSPSSPFPRSIAIWIDFNYDGQFSSNERVLFNPPNTNTTLSATFTVPSSTPYNRIRMRAKIQYRNEAIPCQDTGGGYGEVEDYTITLQQPCPTDLTFSGPTDNINIGILDKKSSNSITGTNAITGSASVSYTSSKIELLPGFKADSGTTFKALPGGCN